MPEEMKPHHVVENFQFEQLSIDGLLRIHTGAFEDQRGSVNEIYREDVFRAAGIRNTFLQDNYSISHRGVLRGIHVQVKHPQAKLLIVLSGAIFDVVVDLRPGSSTFMSMECLNISELDSTQLLIPPGCAHGFLSLAEHTIVLWKTTDVFRPGGELGIRWDDEHLGVPWPDLDIKFLLSERDRNLPAFDERMITRQLFEMDTNL